MLEELKKKVCEANKALPENGLVTWTSGNVLGRDRETGLVVVKPSGVPFEELTADNMVVLDIDGNKIEGDLKPSSDAYTGLYVLRNMPRINSVIHTHSNYATAFAACGMSIPCILTAMCDEFGMDIPCGPFCRIGDEQIGKTIVENSKGSKAVLIQNHGVFTIGETVKEALKAAIMCEDLAKTVYIAKTLGSPIPIKQEDIDALHLRYTTKYGQ
ncbi:MAG: L-ribulose-5-phosphate 4-epimerase [Armatimonadetes bacterium]|nr:L-ribulose-5-phosphate 4-epimerase [Candidatus Hippobium faecium]